MASSSALTMTSSPPEIIHCGIPHPPTSTQTLPPELILQILLHLPVTQIVQQKLVSKTWNRNLIGPEERRFISRFHPHAHGLLFRTYSESLFVANLDSLPLRRRNPDPAADVDPSVANLDYLPIPVPVRRLIGFSRGVLCVESHHDHRLRFYDVFSSTRTPTPMRALPPYSSSSCPASYEGFGYDSRARDYKFVRVTWESRVTRESSWRVQVYHLKSDCWEEIRFCPLRRYDFRAGSVGVFANGCLHWLVTTTTTTEEEGEGEGKEGEEEGKEEEDLGEQMEEEEEEEEEAGEEAAAAAEENLVLKYDLHEGKFREVALPRHQVLRRADLKNTGSSSSSSSSKAAGLIYLCGNLCLWAAFKNFGIWVLTELSEKKPWARLCRFRYMEHNIRNPYPVAFLHRQRRILINGFCDGDGDGDNGKVVEKQLLYCLDSCRVFQVDSHEVIRDLVQSTTTSKSPPAPPPSPPEEEEKRGIRIDGVVGACCGLAFSLLLVVSFSVCSRLCSVHHPRARSMC